ncbi:Pentatricopeptide repeat [Dillenia turbinata]|uniref:Pentatricopeptide repeat n=1 Tax=Dillenia turbinata TaxID=194707 RepID=A0AAN8VPG8_9MAGN
MLRYTSSIYKPRCFKIQSIHSSRVSSMEATRRVQTPRIRNYSSYFSSLNFQRFDAIPKLSFDFSDQILDGVLNNLKLNPTASLGFFKLALKQQKFRPDFKGRMFDEVRLCLNQLVDSSKGKCDVSVVYNQLVRVYKEFSFSPTVFNMILKIYAEKNLTKSALHVFNNMGKCGCKPSLRSCNSLLSSLVRNGEIYVVFQVYDQICKIGIVPDVFTCTVLVNAYSKDGKMEEAKKFIKEMENVGVEPNVVTFHSLINGYVSVGDVEAAERVLQLMSERGIARNVVSYTLLTKGYRKQLKMSEAEREPSLVVDEYAYGVLLDGYCEIGKMEDAIRI